MDYLFASSIKQQGDELHVVVSYDIACQWSKNLCHRVSLFPEYMQAAFNRLSFSFAVPKFHLLAHGMGCQSIFSLNILRFCGRTDGEAIERGWAHLNQLATSLREMAPGFRLDALDDHWQYWNFWRILALGTSVQIF